ncbi:MAG: hypothetical protein IKE46_05210 [Selenomonadaceae bacterium]|nr:hypothetical protein [Selenomonadaceae bacterium]MBR4384114.1 hypothetical protein [Selenomonadaceae bacterium]
MAEYFGTFDGITRDELSGGTDGSFQTIWNVNVGASAAIKRGMLLASDTPTGEFKLVSQVSDAAKVLVIARDDFTADDYHKVTQAYASGKFNRERIILGGTSALTIEPFEDQLRKSNIHVTSIKDIFGKVK